METDELHEAALKIAIRKRLIRPEETYAYLAADGRITRTSYMLVSKRYEKTHRLLLTEVQNFMNKQAALEERENLRQTEEQIKNAFEYAKSEETIKREAFIKRLNELNPIGSTFSLWGAIVSGSGGFMLANALQLTTESAIHQIYQILGIAGGVLLVGVGILVSHANHQSALLRSILTLLDNQRRP